jgi:hypothetical protein
MVPDNESIGENLRHAAGNEIREELDARRAL